MQDAINKKDPNALERALDEIDLKVPVAKVPQEDKQMLDTAKGLLQNIEAKNGSIFLYEFK